MSAICCLLLVGCVATQAESTPTVRLANPVKSTNWLPVRAVHEACTEADVNNWLNHWRNAEPVLCDVDEALGVVVTPRFSDDLRSAALDLLIKRLKEGDSDTSDRVVRGILTTPGDQMTRASALLIALNFGTSGDFLLRKYVEILLEHGRSPKDAGFVCENLIPVLLALDSPSAETVANQLLFVAMREDAPLNSRACALKGLRHVLLAGIGTPAKQISLATRREVQWYAEAVFSNDDEFDLLRENAFQAVAHGPAVSVEVGKAALRILHDESVHSIQLKACAMSMLPNVPDELVEEAIAQALNLIHARNFARDSEIDIVRLAVKTIEKRSLDKDKAKAVISEVANDPRMSKHKSNRTEK